MLDFDINKSIGKRLCLRRTTLGLSQGDVARALGITFQQVQKYEKGKNMVSPIKLLQLAELFGVSVAYFFCRS